MKKYLIILAILGLLFGCSVRKEKRGEVLVKINNYEITQAEFEEAFKASSFGRTDNLESRKEFLNNLINQKLILQDAQRKGLDKDKNFLKMIERFWEQSLLKITLDKKSKEIAGSTYVNDKTIEEIYQRMVKEGKTSKPYDRMYQQIKWELTKAKETQLMSEWINNLNKKAQIKINYSLLEKK